MDTPTLSFGGEVTFTLQAGLTKDLVSVESSDLTLKTLKDLACEFIDTKVSRIMDTFVIFSIDLKLIKMLYTITSNGT